jgi:riboflavin synthase
VSLIPETLKRTTLGAKQPGETVNLEVDVIAKYVEKLLNAQGPAVDPAADGAQS